MKETRKRKRLFGFIIDLLVICLLMELTFRLESALPFPTVIKVFRVLVVFGGYHIGMEYLFGKTIGKFILKTTVVNRFGEKISLRESAIRFFSRLIPFEFLSLALGADARAWHDVLSQTYVIDDKSHVS